MNDTKSLPALPDRLSNNPSSRFYEAEFNKHEIGIILSGQVRDDVEEYCISEGWVIVTSAKASDDSEQSSLTTLKGVVEVFYNKYPS